MEREATEHGGGPGQGLDPEAVAEVDFAKVRRGFDPDSVRARLREAAEEIRRLNALVGSLSERVAELEAAPPETLESRRVAEALGDEATRVLQSATDAARQRIERAEAEHAGGEGSTIESSPAPASAAVRLYDVEAEPGAGLDSGAGPQAGHASGTPGDAVAVASHAAEPPSADAEAIFARLRSITLQPVGAPEPRSAAGGVTADGPPPPTGPEAVNEPAEEYADEPDELAEEYAGRSEAAADDLVGAARAVAVGGIARRLKRLVVDEQGELLDAVRRTGARAVRSTITGDAKAYTRAVRAPLQDFASDMDVSIDDVDLEAAGSAVLSALVEPVRKRLGELAATTDDPDELATSVRSIYRESRSRRADAAARAAFSAGWPEPIS